MQGDDHATILAWAEAFNRSAPIRRRHMHTRHVRLQSIVLTSFLAAAGVACATEAPPKPVALDPSNPAAAEAPRPAAMSLADPTPIAPTPTAQPAAAPAPSPAPAGEHGHDHGKQDVAVYTCPMHPEVTSDKPGKCPKCGMKLVLKKPGAPEGQK
jgi:hypothetical protein